MSLGQRQAEEEDPRQHAHARCMPRKGVGGIVSRMEGVGRCPAEDYVTSLSLSTSILENLVEPQLWQSFPFPSLAPLLRQLHIISMGIQAGWRYTAFMSSLSTHSPSHHRHALHIHSEFKHSRAPSRTANSVRRFVFQVLHQKSVEERSFAGDSPSQDGKRNASKPAFNVHAHISLLCSGSAGNCLLLLLSC